MKIYQAGTYSRRGYLYEAAMKTFLAGNCGYRTTNYFSDLYKEMRPNILESYYYVNDKEVWFKEIKPYCKDFLLDSGAFSFMQDKKKVVDWEQYADNYARFITDNNIDKYFELDIDSVTNLNHVENLRKRIEDKTGKPSIPVWHKSRGLEYWHKICESYDYVAIGGIVSGEIKKSQYNAFTHLLNIAKQKNTKVHGLGFTNLEGVKKYPFYSVDSTAWLYGNLGGYVYHFNGQDMLKVKQKDKKLNAREAAIHNFKEWVRFSNYLEKHY